MPRRAPKDPHAEPERREASPTRARLIDAAALALERDGIVGATTKEIVRLAGLTEPTLYLHFSSKDELLQATLHDRLMLPALVAELPEDAAARPVREVLCELIATILRAHQALTPMLGVVLADPKLLATVRADPPAEGKLDGLTRVRDFFAAEQRAGRIGRATPPQVLARLLFGASFHHAVMTALFGEGTMTPTGEAFVEAVADALVAAAGPI